MNAPAFYIEDYEDAKQERGYYYDLKELPLPLAFSNEELMKNIESFDEENTNKDAGLLRLDAVL